MRIVPSGDAWHAALQASSAEEDGASRSQGQARELPLVGHARLSSLHFPASGSHPAKSDATQSRQHLLMTAATTGWGGPNNAKRRPGRRRRTPEHWQARYHAICQQAQRSPPAGFTGRILAVRPAGNLAPPVPAREVNQGSGAGQGGRAARWGTAPRRPTGVIHHTTNNCHDLIAQGRLRWEFVSHQCRINSATQTDTEQLGGGVVPQRWLGRELDLETLRLLRTSAIPLSRR